MTSPGQDEAEDPGQLARELAGVLERVVTRLRTTALRRFAEPLPDGRRRGDAIHAAAQFLVDVTVELGAGGQGAGEQGAGPVGDRGARRVDDPGRLGPPAGVGAARRMLPQLGDAALADLLAVSGHDLVEAVAQRAAVDRAAVDRALAALRALD